MYYIKLSYLLTLIGLGLGFLRPYEIKDTKRKSVTPTTRHDLEVSTRP